MVPGRGNGFDGGQDSSHAGSEEEGTDAVFQGGDAFLNHVGGGVVEAGVDVAAFGEGEAVCPVLAVFEGEGGGEVERHGSRTVI